MANSAVTGAQAPKSSPAAPGAVFEKPFSNIHSTAPFSQISNADFEPATVIFAFAGPHQFCKIR